MTNKVVNKKFITRIRVYEDHPEPMGITIGKNKKELVRKIKPYHTNNKEKLISVPFLFWKRCYKNLKRKLRSLKIPKRN